MPTHGTYLGGYLGVIEAILEFPSMGEKLPKNVHFCQKKVHF